MTSLIHQFEENIYDRKMALYINAILLFVVSENFFKKILDFIIINILPIKYDYLSWAFFFYYPQKKFIFYEYLLFLGFAAIYFTFFLFISIKFKQINSSYFRRHYLLYTLIKIAIYTFMTYQYVQYCFLIYIGVIIYEYWNWKYEKKYIS